MNKAKFRRSERLGGVPEDPEPRTNSGLSDEGLLPDELRVAVFSHVSRSMVSAKNQSGRAGNSEAEDSEDSAKSTSDSSTSSVDFHPRRPKALKPGQLVCKGYEVQQVLGSGGYGHVYRVKQVQTGKLFALKQTKALGKHNKIDFSMLREAAVMRQLKHVNIVSGIRYFLPDLPTAPISIHETLDSFRPLADLFSSSAMDVETGEGYLISILMELADRTLAQRLDHPRTGEKTPLAASSVKSLMTQLLRGLDHMHSNMVVHRDIKPCNLLLSADGKTLKIADLGLARTYHSPPLASYSTAAGTAQYRAPETCLHVKSYGAEVDIWSAGAIFAELVSGEMLVCVRAPDDLDSDIISKIFEIFGFPTTASWPEFEKQLLGAPAEVKRAVESLRGSRAVATGLNKVATGKALDLISKTLSYDKSKRPSAREALEHAYFSPQAKVESENLDPVSNGKVLESKSAELKQEDLRTARLLKRRALAAAQ